ncbi:putative metallophosphoesterase At3g03305 isoform X2 [Wolffia australiana]
MGGSRLLLMLLTMIVGFVVLIPSSNRGFCIAKMETLISREFFPMNDDLAWIVQVSDLHISEYHHDRAGDLDRLLAPALRVIQPSLVIISGDLTDAKNKEGTSTSQNEFEWIQYRKSMDIVMKKAGISEKIVFDIRGNHDKYGVPCAGHKLDFFSVFSTSARMNRTGAIQSISLEGKEWAYMFLGIDDSMAVGLRGPSNVFGHPSDKLLQALDSELCYWDAIPSKLTRKVVFGHFPLSFTTSSPTTKIRYDDVLSKRSVSAYLCGHLHAMSNSKLWRQHGAKGVSDSEINKRTQFWEWELGDWKGNRLMRILAIDRGDVSFVDINLRRQLKDDDFLTTVLITYPVDSRSMSRKQDERSVRNDVNALVFSRILISNVTARVYDSLKGYMIVEEIALQRASESRSSHPLFTAKWLAESYKSPLPDRYFIQVSTVDGEGRETKTEMRPFSVEGRCAPLPISWAAYFLLHVSWEVLYAFLLWSNVVFLTALLLLPKLLKHFRGIRKPRQPWALSLSLSSSSIWGNLWSRLCWFLIEGSRNGFLWPCMGLYVLYLLSFSWFRVKAASEQGDFGKMSPFGWMIESSGCQVERDKVGVPDVMNISLPFMYFVVAPLFLLIYALFAERSLFYMKKPSEGKHESDALRVTSRKRWGRRGILLSCFVLAYSYIKIFFFLGRAYGFREIALSPAVCWGPPILLATAIYLS